MDNGYLDRDLTRGKRHALTRFARVCRHHRKVVTGSEPRTGWGYMGKDVFVPKGTRASTPVLPEFRNLKVDIQTRLAFT